MGIVFLVLQIVFDILAFIGYIRLTVKIDDTHESAEIDIRHLEKQSDIFKDSIKLQNDSIRSVLDLTKKVIEYIEPKELDTEKHDTKALVSGWDADEIDEPELVSIEEFKKNIVDICVNGTYEQKQDLIDAMTLQRALLGQTQQCIYPWQPLQSGQFQSGSMLPLWYINRRLEDM